MAHYEKKLRERTEEYLERVDKAEIKHVDSGAENTGMDFLVHRPPRAAIRDGIALRLNNERTERRKA